MANPTNLNEYYQSQGQALPTVQARAPLYAQYGGTGAYSGTAAQNSFLLSKLTSGAQSPASSTSASPTTTAGAIGTVLPVTVPPVSPIPNVSTELATYLNNLNAQVNTNQAAVTAKEGEIAQQKTDAQLLADQLTNQTADRIAAEDQQGLPALGKDLQDLTNLSRSQTAQYIQGIQNSELNGGLAANVNAKQNFLNRQNAIDSMLTNSLISAKQGDITNAQAQVDRAISLKYDPIKQQLQNKLDFIQMNYNELDRADKKLADVKTQQWNLQMKQLEIEQQKEQDIQSIALEAAKNGAPASVLNNIGKSTSVADATIKASGFFQDPLDVQYKKMQIANIKSEIANRGASAGNEIDAANLLAYAQQYAATGNTPTGLPKGTFGVVAQTAAALPKQKGEVVSTSTGVKSNTTGAELQKGITGIYDAKNILAQMQTILNNKKAGSFTNNDRITYNTLSGEFADALSRARSGAALTETEIQQYKSKLPSWNNLIGGNAKFNATNMSLTGKLDANLSTNGLSMYGYSKVPLGDEMYTVGDIVVNESGQAGRVNPDGSISIIN